MNRTNSILHVIVIAIMMAATSLWQTAGAKVRLVASTNSGNVHKLETPGTDDGDRTYNYGCNWEQAFYNPKLFTVSASKKVTFCPGNLLHFSEFKSVPIIISGKTELVPNFVNKWQIADHQWESLSNGTDIYYLQREKGGVISIFGTSTTIVNDAEYTKYYDTFKFDEKDDWSDMIPEDYDYRHMLTSLEWNYLINQRDNAASLHEVGKLNCRVEKDVVSDIYGLFLYPDGYEGQKAGTTPVDSVKWFAMEEAGAVFLPTNQNYSGHTCGMYWAFTLGGSYSALYFDISGEVKIITVDNIDQCAIRMTSYYVDPSEEEMDVLKGEGTVESPYEIGSAADMRAFRDKVNAGQNGLCAILTRDVDLGGTSNWSMATLRTGSSSVNPYVGTFDGNGYTIKNLKSTMGLFGLLTDGAVVKDLTITGEVNGNTSYMGGLCGAAIVSSTNVTIQNVICNVSVTPQNDMFTGTIGGVGGVGGIVGLAGGNGEASLVIDNCTYGGTISIAEKYGESDKVGEFIGSTMMGEAEVTDCSFTGMIIMGSTVIKGTPQISTAIPRIKTNDDKVVIYDLMGRKHDKLQKGINIVNGKKVLVK